MVVLVEALNSAKELLQVREDSLVDGVILGEELMQRADLGFVESVRVLLEDMPVST